MSSSLFFTTFCSPLGELKLIASHRGLVAVLWEKDPIKRDYFNNIERNQTHPLLMQTSLQLEDYFLGKRQLFDLPLDPIGTAFQLKVWQALLTIPFGQTRSYKQIAQLIGHPQAVRAVGAANGRNPISIICGCHRVIGASGKLVGFSGGLQAKEFLLKLEGIR